MFVCVFHVFLFKADFAKGFNKIQVKTGLYVLFYLAIYDIEQFIFKKLKNINLKQDLWRFV